MRGRPPRSFPQFSTQGAFFVTKTNYHKEFLYTGPPNDSIKKNKRQQTLISRLCGKPRLKFFPPPQNATCVCKKSTINPFVLLTFFVHAAQASNKNAPVHNFFLLLEGLLNTDRKWDFRYAKELSHIRSKTKAKFVIFQSKQNVKTLHIYYAASAGGNLDDVNDSLAPLKCFEKYPRYSHT